ncbi:MAG: RNA methyltransferase [Bacteroidales bacterium]|nr:RNA methyltransferase [Bacteroidales bacterium]MCF8389449.1 RNA methyltransferase [Bacteroidales bacterium]
MDPITSTQNSQIKELLKLDKPRERRAAGLFKVEGLREIQRAWENQYKFSRIFFCKKFLNQKSEGLLNQINAGFKIEVSQNVFSRIAYRDNSDGLLALAEPKNHVLNGLEHRENNLYLVIETVEKPGNLGALLRTADASGIHAVIVCDNNTDIYNPNVIRSSVGCLFTKKVVITDTESCIQFFKSNKVKIFAAALQNSEIYTAADYTKSSAIVLGAEDIGLSESWRRAADKIVAIPMKGDIDSLNVSVSAAVLIYEAIRQRNRV